MSILRKSALSVAGGGLIAAGIVMLVTPGPGVLAIGAGLAVWAQEYDWAKRLLERFQARLTRRKKSGS